MPWSLKRMAKMKCFIMKMLLLKLLHGMIELKGKEDPEYSSTVVHSGGNLSNLIQGCPTSEGPRPHVA